MAETEEGSPEGSHGAEAIRWASSAREALREYWLEGQVEWLRIPPESLGNPAVRHYVSMVEDLDVLGVPRYCEPEVEDFLAGSVRLRLLPAAGRGSVPARGVHRRYRNSDGLRAALDAAAGAFGWTVRQIDARAPDVGIAAPTGLWRDDSNRSLRPRPPPAGDDGLPAGPHQPGSRRLVPLSEDRLRSEAERVGVPVALLEVDPTLRQMFTYLIAARDLHAEIDETAGLPERQT